MNPDLKRACALQEKNDPGRTRVIADRLLKSDPDNEMANFLYGTALIQEKQFGQSLEYLNKSNSSGAYANRIYAYRMLGRLTEAAELGRKALKDCKPDKNIVPALANYASSLLELGLLSECENALRLAVELDPKHPDSNWNLGLCLLKQKRWPEGWDLYDWGFRTKERFARPYFDEIAEWHGQDLKDKNILIWGEQGLGDEILFASCIPDLINQGANVTFECHPRLEEIFSNSFDCRVVGHRKDKRYQWLDDEVFHFHAPLGYLPKYFRRTDDEFPKQGYLKTDPIFDYDRHPERKPRIGISWRGGTKKDGASRRSLPLEKFAECLTGDVEFVSLQYGDVYPEVEALNLKGFDLVHDDAVLENYTETAKLVKSCDLVISVITAVVHLAGALDVPTWCLTPVGAPWKFHSGEKMIWHPSVKMYQQRERYNWDTVLNQINEDLETWLRKRNGSPNQSRSRDRIDD